MDISKLLLTEDEAYEAYRVNMDAEAVADAAARKALWGLASQVESGAHFTVYELREALKQAGLEPWKEKP